MTELRPVILVTGVLLVGLAAAMLAPMATDMITRPGVAWRAFAWSAMFTGFIGAALAIAARGPVEALTVRAAFLLTVVSWLALTAFAATPFVVSGALDPTDAFFEAMSGLTTTGSTVMTGLDFSPPGLLLWRAILQWIGGVGIVVTAIAVLPMLRVGGMQLFRLESSDRSEKVLPRATQIAALIAVIYLGLTAACALVYAALGVPAFDAVAHAMSTMSTGGFSTSDASMGAFTAHGADIAAVFFMVLAAIPFGVFILAVRGDIRGALGDPQTRAFVVMLVVLCGVMAIYLAWTGVYDGPNALRYAAFNVVSVISGTGYATADYAGETENWGRFAFGFFFVLMFLGGCAGSTTCGIKVFRLQVIAIALRNYVAEMTRPAGVSPMRYNGRKLPMETVYSVLSFLFLYLLVFVVLSILLGVIGLDEVSAISAAATAIGNVGPGLGAEVGPSGTFSELPDPAKWVLSAGMLIGRLEVLTVLVLFAPSFWRS